MAEVATRIVQPDLIAVVVDGLRRAGLHGLNNSQANDVPPALLVRPCEAPCT